MCGLSGCTAEDLLQLRDGHITDAAGVGHSGKGLRRALSEDGPFELVLILIGTNDLGLIGQQPNLNAQRILERITALHRVCHKAGVRTVAFTPPTIHKQPFCLAQRELHQLMTAWAKGESNWVLDHVDLEDLAPRKVAALWDDEIHLSAAGQRQLGKQLALRVAPLLKGAENAAKLDAKRVVRARSAPAPEERCASPPLPSPEMKPGATTRDTEPQRRPEGAAPSRPAVPEARVEHVPAPLGVV